MTPLWPHNRYQESVIWSWRLGSWHRVGRVIRTWTLRDFHRFQAEYHGLLNKFAVSGPERSG